MLELENFPIYLYFKNGNTYSGAHKGMRYFIRQDKRDDPEDPAGKKKIPYLTACVWPEPWSVENTDPAKVTTKEFAPNQQGLEAAVAWLKEMRAARRRDWEEIPSILDCEPWHPAPPAQEDAPPWE